MVNMTPVATRPSSGVILAARHLDLTEGPLGVPGHIVNDSDRSALRTVLGYVSQQYNQPEAVAEPAPVSAERPPKNLRDAAQRLATLMDRLNKAGYEIDTDHDSGKRLRLSVQGNIHHWAEVDNPHGYWDVTCTSGADADTATSDVTVPRAALDLLVELAAYTRGGGQTTDIGKRAIEALDAAGLLPKEAAA